LEGALKIVIPGGSGHVGTLLARTFQRDGHDVVVLSRSPRVAQWPVVRWDGATVGPWAQEIDGADVVINLAGRSVNCRYNSKNRAEILTSRVCSTRAVGTAIAASSRPPRTWLQASTATIYAHCFDAANDERTGILGGEEPNAPSTWRFSIEVARAWERALAEARVPSSTRKVALRSAIVMQPEAGGVFAALMGLARVGLGGRAGSGRQYVSWIHGSDFARALGWIIEHDELTGAVNVASPNPLPQQELMRALRRAAGIRVALPATTSMLEFGARFLHTETELVLKSRRVIPGRLLESGFSFTFPEWDIAVEDLVRRWNRPEPTHADRPSVAA
jgi:uncharacterized protein (TIGR01777 family)